jgi:hypothetical protein
MEPTLRRKAIIGLYLKRDNFGTIGIISEHSSVDSLASYPRVPSGVEFASHPVADRGLNTRTTGGITVLGCGTPRVARRLGDLPLRRMQEHPPSDERMVKYPLEFSANTTRS